MDRNQSGTTAQTDKSGIYALSVSVAGDSRKQLLHVISNLVWLSLRPTEVIAKQRLFENGDDYHGFYCSTDSDRYVRRISTYFVHIFLCITVV